MDNSPHCEDYRLITFLEKYLFNQCITFPTDKKDFFFCLEKEIFSFFKNKYCIAPSCPSFYRDFIDKKHIDQKGFENFLEFLINLIFFFKKCNKKQSY